MRDTNGDGAFTSSDTLLELSVTNWSTLMPYLGIASTDVCPSTLGSSGRLLTRFGLSVADAITAVNANVGGSITFSAAGATQAQLNELCTKALILWVRGADLGDEDSDTNRTETRPSVLGDIFHSTPVSVEPPVEPFLCELGIVNQCVRTLYSQQTGEAPTPLASYTGQLDCNGNPTGSRTAYDKWAFDYRKREKLVVVGSNGGMLHAFRNGTATESCTSGNSTLTWSKGTGNEVWAFVPPDLLSRLQDQIDGHAYGVDGDIMVRDVWADGSGGIASPNHIKEADEYHTVVIGAEGRGGTHYFALEPTWDASGNATATPRFLWMFPQPCSSEAALFGKTFYSLSPKPPPVGPVLVKSSDAAAVDRQGMDTAERWVVALSGGWSPGRERGRGVYLVDAYAGSVNGRSDNLWWKYEYADDASGNDQSPRKYLTQSVTAPVALVDYGADADPRQDGFFDTALFADLAGQVWVARLYQPGEVDPSTKLVRNWFGGRALEMDRDGTSATTGDPSDPSDETPKSIAQRQPFYYLPSSVIEPGSNRLIALLGSGNRYALLEGGAGICRFDNPLACAKSGCGEAKIAYKVEAPLAKVDKAETHWKDRSFEHAKLDDSNRSASLCGNAGSASFKGEFTDFKVSSCDLPGTTNDTSPGDVNKRKVECGLDSSGNLYTCSLVSNVDKHGDLFSPANADTTGLGFNRFMGFWAYGGARVMTGGSANPKTFDDGRFDDRTDLTNVTSVGCTATSCDGGAPEGSPGWVMDYNSLETKTATGAAVLASCALWSSLSPQITATSTDPCISGASPTSRLFQANVLTGQPNCAAGFSDGGVYVRFQERGVVSPPPEPAATIQISRTGQIRYSAMIVEPGQSQATTVDIAGGQDSLQLVYQLPISRELHDCRHRDGGCVVVP